MNREADSPGLQREDPSASSLLEGNLRGCQGFMRQEGKGYSLLDTHSSRGLWRRQRLPLSYWSPNPAALMGTGRLNLPNIE